MAWFDPALVPDPTAWLAERLGEMAWAQMEATPATSPEVATMVEAVPEVPGGYADLLFFFPRMKPASVGGIQDLLTIRATGQSVIVLHPGLTLIA